MNGKQLADALLVELGKRKRSRIHRSFDEDSLADLIRSALDPKGDHLMDAMRYLVMAGIGGLQKAPRPEAPVYEYRTWDGSEQRWMH